MKRNLFCAALLMLVASTGCLFTRTVYVPDGAPVRLRETLYGVGVWVLDADGKPLAGEVDIPEGWFAAPVAPKDKTN